MRKERVKRLRIRLEVAGEGHGRGRDQRLKERNEGREAEAMVPWIGMYRKANGRGYYLRRLNQDVGEEMKSRWRQRHRRGGE